MTEDQYKNMIRGLNASLFANDVENFLQLPKDNISNNKFNAFSENNVIGRTLQVYAYDNKLNGSDLSKEINLSYEETKKILKGYIIPSDTTIEALANALKINVTELEEAYVSQNIINFDDATIIKAFKIYCKMHGIKQSDLIKKYNNMHFNTLLNANVFHPKDRDKQIQTMCMICNLSLDKLYGYATTYDPNRYDNLFSIVSEACLRNNVNLSDIIDTYHSDKKNLLIKGNVNDEDKWLMDCLSLLNIPVEDVRKYFKKSKSSSTLNKKTTIKSVVKTEKEEKKTNEDISSTKEKEYKDKILKYENKIYSLSYELNMASSKHEDEINTYKEKIYYLENQVSSLSSKIIELRGATEKKDHIINVNDLDVVDKFIDLNPKSQIAVLKLAAKLLSDDYLQKLVFEETNNIRNILERSIYLMSCLSKLDDKSVIIDLINNLS